LDQAFGAPRLALPDEGYVPTKLLEPTLGGQIARLVSLKLRNPVLGPGLWLPRESAALVLMPEASMNENGQATPGQNDIRRSRQVAPMQTKSEAQAVKSLAHTYFRSGIFSPDTGHVRAALGRIQTVVHRWPDYGSRGVD
jgi:hypothetical protein